MYRSQRCPGQPPLAKVRDLNVCSERPQW